MSQLFYHLPSGVFTAALTPLDRDLNPDHAHLIAHLKWLLSRGNDGIALLGTTGEANSFSVDERIRIIDAVADAGIPTNKLMIGTGCCSLTDTAILTRHAHACRAGGILLLPPFYYKGVKEAGLEAYVDRLLDWVGQDDMQIYLYHFPRLSGVPWPTPLVEKLVYKYPQQIVGMKDSGGEWAHTEEVLKALPKFRVYAGSERFLLATLKAGGVGCISATTNLTSLQAHAVKENWLTEDGEQAQETLSALRTAFDGYPFVGALKFMFQYYTGDTSWGHVRPPNQLISNDEGHALIEKLKQLNFQPQLTSSAL